MSEIRVARFDDLVAGQPTLVEANSTRIVLVRVGDSVYACNDVCGHQGGPLSDGRVSGTKLACPWHGWMYDVKSGECLMPSRGGSIPSYAVRVDGPDVWVDLP